MRDDIIIHNDNDNTGVIEENVSEREVQRQLARGFESKYKRRRTMMIKIGVAVVKYAMRNEASHAMTHIGGPAPGPLEGLSSFVGRFSSSEVLANMSMI